METTDTLPEPDRTQYPEELCSSKDKDNDKDESTLEKVDEVSMNDESKMQVDEPLLIDDKQDVAAPHNSDGQKRKNVSEFDRSQVIKKTMSFTSDEKKIVNLRKNIRDVMEANQLDNTTLKAQHEESERLARVVEQQKIIRECQRQAAVITQFDRFISNHKVKRTDESADDGKGPAQNLCTESENTRLKTCNEVVEIDEDKAEDQEKNKISGEVVTIEDSSSDDDCIVLSDDEDEEIEEEIDDPNNSGLHVKDEFNIPDEMGRVVINIGHPESEEDIFIAPQIARTIKPHQIGGVRFLFDNVIESTKRFQSSSGFGCILAHSMGLGKTLQVVCFCDIFLRYTPSKTVLCVMPINTLQNWVAEFDMWIPKTTDDPDKVRPRHFDIFVLNDQQKTLSARAKVICKWKEEGGVLLIGYELFRLLALKLTTSGKRRSKKWQSKVDENESHNSLSDNVYEALVKPGPDLVICDEGHRIKNSQAGISQALKQIRTRRRIVLTGYPLQNNLLEYWCMVDFVRPNYLGSRTEFCNMFERPIQNGMCIDSTPDDIKLMRYRAHVLHSLLVGFVQRRSHTVLQQSLPEKLEFVILTRMTDMQRQLYDTFMNDVVRSKNVPNPLKAFAVCCKIWNHPDILYDLIKREESCVDLDIDEVEDIVGQSINSSKEKIAGFQLPPSPLPLTPAPATSQPSIPPNPTPQSGQIENQKLNYGVAESHSNNNYSSTTNCQNHFHNGSGDVANYHSNPLYSELNQYNSNPLNSPINGSGYCQELHSSYYPYHPILSSVGVPVQPNYVGIMVKQTSTKSVDDSKTASSSEIVDLDTKEIKTIETDIDMDKNIVVEKDYLKQTTQTDSKLNSDVTAGTGTGTDGTENEQKLRGCDKISYDWALKLMKGYEQGLISSSPKMAIFFCILNESVKIGDRVLLFSQSLLTLNLIEKFLQVNQVPGYNAYWSHMTHYFRLDGSTTPQEREKLVTEFNKNANVKLFLVSTKAGSLGINLIGANRVVIFDASWNPCHDTQAIYRIYRYGQKRSCFVYRLVMDKCLEKKIYDRQIKKQGISDRVVDECNPDAHLSMKDVTNVCHDYDDDDEKNISVPFSATIDSYSDTIMKKILHLYKNNLSKEPFLHESLLVDRKSEKLSQAEKRLAHRSYEMQKKTSSKQPFIGTSNRIQYHTVRKDGSFVTRPIASIRPIQSTRIQNNQKNSGLRTTRWIPAEVWQKQGMTAQEMSLPLDVVIPTNSSNKSKIIIKAGQRVMVLKSAKGIYMQLDSGKIIAIRTLNKPNPMNKSDKPDVIDITNEPEGTTEAKLENTTNDTLCSKEISPFTDTLADLNCTQNSNTNDKEKCEEPIVEKQSETLKFQNQSPPIDKSPVHFNNTLMPAYNSRNEPIIVEDKPKQTSIMQIDNQPRLLPPPPPPQAQPPPPSPQHQPQPQPPSQRQHQPQPPSQRQHQPQPPPQHQHQPQPPPQHQHQSQLTPQHQHQSQTPPQHQHQHQPQPQPPQPPQHQHQSQSQSQSQSQPSSQHQSQPQSQPSPRHQHQPQPQPQPLLQHQPQPPPQLQPQLQAHLPPQHQPHMHHNFAGRNSMDMSGYSDFQSPFSEYPVYGSHDSSHQNIRYHQSTHTNISPSLNDFYAYYPQWSPFVIPPQGNDTSHLMHAVTKVQSNNQTNQWQYQ